MKTSSNPLPSLFSAIIFILGALLLFGVALILGFAALASSFSGIGIKAEQTIFLVAFGFEGVLLVAAAFFSFQKYLQKPSADQDLSLPISNWLIAVFISVAGGSIAVGYVISTSKALDWFFLPFLTIPAIVLPLAVLLALGTRRLPLGTRWQTWNVLGMAMTLTPLVLFTLEIFIAIVIFFFVVVYILGQPELSARLQALAQQIMIVGPQSQAAQELLSPFLTKPGVVATALIYISVLVPAVEEMFKPLGVWLLAGKLELQAQGFALGALSGAGYALIETIGVSGQTADWASLLITRVGTGLLHVTTSALMGAAIVLAWRERRYLRWVGTYLLAILLHGLWNAVAILFTFSNLAQVLKPASRLSTIQPLLAIAMTILAVGLLTILVGVNRKMRGTLASPPAQTFLQNEDIDASETM